MPSLPPSPEPDNSSWNPWVIATVALFCIVFLILSYFSILKRICRAINDVTFGRTSVRRRLLNEANPNDPSLQFHSHGLESSIMNSLPITEFKKNVEGEAISNNTDCAVCLGEFEEGELLKHLPSCRHAFHVSCIDTWFETHSNCPICRSHVSDPTSSPEDISAIHTLFETRRRENELRERAAHYQILRFEILHSSALSVQL